MIIIGTKSDKITSQSLKVENFVGRNYKIVQIYSKIVLIYIAFFRGFSN